MKKYKLLFISTMMFGTLISISSYSWMGMWMGLEINLISIIPLLNKNDMFSSESSVKYFITQALASAILMFSIIIFSLNQEMVVFLSKTSVMMINSSLLTKMGAAPFHFWFPEVMEGLSWMNCFIMLTWQKIAPMVMLMYNSSMTMFMTIIIIASMLVSGIMGFNQVSMRKIMAYSSINHIGWMIGALTYSQPIWLIYFVIYTLISANIILLLEAFKIFFLKQMIALQIPPISKTIIALNFFSLGGLPPFLGFMPKWFTIQTLIENNQLVLAFTMIVLTLLTLFFYMRITLSALVLSQNNMLPSKTEPKSFWFMAFNLVALLGLIALPLLFSLI
uniref:NADH dehydrogenase subunit 2 n=1 Tax=Tenebroides mauritanicus TaxID=433272 RepID=UPI002001404D|nr:NADH dehydrogenase subunit 2 [Tenebroides mauritanicus]UNZ12730.1 NADH dehydrogenase subunit 2 [Tenebroides mauritanicus]